MDEYILVVSEVGENEKEEVSSGAVSDAIQLRERGSVLFFVVGFHCRSSGELASSLAQ